MRKEGGRREEENVGRLNYKCDCHVLRSKRNNNPVLRGNNQLLMKLPKSRVPVA